MGAQPAKELYGGMNLHKERGKPKHDRRTAFISRLINGAQPRNQRFFAAGVDIITGFAGETRIRLRGHVQT